jgi:hypothetical protein
VEARYALDGEVFCLMILSVDGFFWGGGGDGRPDW